MKLEPITRAIMFVLDMFGFQNNTFYLLRVVGTSEYLGKFYTN